MSLAFGLRRPLQTALYVAVVALALVAPPGAAATAADYPSKPLRIIVPFDPGAAVDAVARILASGLGAQSGKPALVENRPGGMSLIGAEKVAQSDPDGYTLLFTVSDTFAIIPHLSKTAPFDPNRGLIPVTLVGKIVMVMLTNPSVPANSLPALIDYARAHPTSLSYASSGPGSATNLAMEVLKSEAKINFVHVPFKGNAPALQATTSGEVQLTIAGYGTAKGLIAAGALRPIAVTGAERAPQLPHIPATGELGYPKVDATSWLMVAAPAATPPAVVAQINAALSRVLRNPVTKKQIEARDIVIADMGPKESAEWVAQQYRLNGEAVRIAGVHRE